MVWPERKKFNSLQDDAMKAFDLTVMMYHYVRDPGDQAELDSGIPGMPVSYFESQLDFLVENYHIISWPILRDCLTNAAPLPARACLLTFDDGVLDHYVNVYPALKRRDLSGLFFALARSAGMPMTLAHKIHFLIARLGIQRLREAYLGRLDQAQRLAFELADARYRPAFESTSLSDEVDIFKLVLQRDLSSISEPILGELFRLHIGPEIEIASPFFLNAEQIEQMAAGGMYFGGHSQNHPWFDWIPADSQWQEIEASRQWLAGIEPGPWPFAYPYGGMNDRSSAFLQAQDFLCAFTTKPQAAHSDPYRIGRFDAEAYPNQTALINLSGERS
jgi:peptidoglycan/xylan/chitin deacetylase (PgdA/CDA1 family)